MTSPSLWSVYQTLYGHYGEQHWWPGESALEVMVGAVLTQNTAWPNVEKAILAMKQEGLMSAEAIVSTAPQHLAQVIRPSGYFNIKARRLQSLCQWLVYEGGIEALAYYDDDGLRAALLSLHGIGPETADDILLYACQRPVFVIDAYTRRLFSRLSLFTGDEAYDELRLAVEADLRVALDKPGSIVAVYNEYHALIVRHAKAACYKKFPACRVCCLNAVCPSASLFGPNMV